MEVAGSCALASGDGVLDELEHRVPTGFLDKPLYRVIALGVEEWGRDPDVADIALQHWACGLRPDLHGA